MLERMPEKIIFVTPVWGNTYIKTFLELCLPSLFTPGNFKSLNISAEFLIYTASKDRQEIINHKNFKLLCELIDVKILEIPDSSFTNSYNTITWVHQRAFDYADHLDGGIFIVMPDMFFSRDFIKNILKHIESGVRLISTPNYSSNVCEMYDALTPLTKADGSIEVDNFTLARISLARLHQISKLNVWNEPDDYFLSPRILYWKVGDGVGLLGRYFYGCYMYIYPRHKFSKLYSTFDCEYIFSACPDIKDHYICTDSNELLVIEMSDKGRNSAGFPKSFVHHLNDFIGTLNPYQLNHAKNLVKIDTGLGSPDDWKNAEANFSHLMTQISSY